MTNVATPTTQINPNEGSVVLGKERQASEAAVLSAILGNDCNADPLQVALAALDGIGRDLAMLTIAEDADGGPSDELRARYLETLHTRANGAAEAVRRLVRKAPMTSTPSASSTARRFDVDLSGARDALANVAGARALLPKGNPDMRLPARMLDEAILDLGYMCADLAEQEQDEEDAAGEKAAQS